MGTINLGRIKLVNRGTWSSANTYAIDDFVQFTDNGVVSTYIAVAASTNQTPSTSGTENSNFWKFLAKGVSVAVGNNKLVTSDGSGNLQGVSIGSVGEALKVTGSNTVGFGTAGALLQVKQFTKTSSVDMGTSNNYIVLFAPLDCSSEITPASASNMVIVDYFATIKHGQTWRSSKNRIEYSTDGGSNYKAIAGGSMLAYIDGTHGYGNMINISCMFHPNTTNAVKVRVVHNGHNSGHGRLYTYNGEGNNDNQGTGSNAPDTVGGVVAATTALRLTEVVGSLATISVTA